MYKGKILILLSFFTILLLSQASAQVKDSVLKPIDTAKTKVKQPLSRQDSMKAKYVNPGKVAGRKAVFRSMIFPGLGQIYNIQLLNDGYGTRAGKSQAFQKVYTISKIVAIYGGFTALTISYIDSRKNYNIFLREAQYRAGDKSIAPNPALARYSDAGIVGNKSTFSRNGQIVLFSYGLLYAANIIDAYVAARLHFFNIDDKLSFKVLPSMLNTNNMYGFSATPALKLSLTF
ncbi:hypothetical protein DHW03_12445 [Pedobacter yonginense]|uniref:DUF5683 domain-containing protein n=1 Tax=Pedobacter yonginense TaxID=651869 RepID=A0A317EKF1_9SPHI|nr:DUF5683 domain-containing protein [Pedobacter yonginense]PWS26835.1 hypothetical protein DHW03_12445 [Pedobacter yonginense]